MIRVLVASAQVSPSACSAAAELKKQIEAALSYGLRNGTITLEFIGATEGALRAKFNGQSWDVLHFIAPVRTSQAARYAVVDLESSNGATRSITGQFLTDLFAECHTKFLILHSCDPKASFESFAPAIAARCSSSVVTAHDLSPRSLNVFLAKLHSALSNGEQPDSIAVPSGSVKFWSSKMEPASPVEIKPETLINGRSNTNEADEAKAAIDRKRAMGHFDVFLCHNSLDKPSVRKVAKQLKDAGILPWLDEWELPPGMPWMPLLEKQIVNIGSAAVFVGAAGFGPWQQEELDGFLRQFAKRHLPVIPVLLPDAPLEPELPVFLGARGWVDFRSESSQPLSRLIWAITGVRPKDL